MCNTVDNNKLIVLFVYKLYAIFKRSEGENVFSYALNKTHKQSEWKNSIIIIVDAHTEDCYPSFSAFAFNYSLLHVKN